MRVLEALKKYRLLVRLTGGKLQKLAAFKVNFPDMPKLNSLNLALEESNSLNPPNWDDPNCRLRNSRHGTDRAFDAGDETSTESLQLAAQLWQWHRVDR